MTGFFCKLMDMFCQKGSGPYFSGITKIYRFLTRNVNNPRFFGIGDFSIAATAGSIREGILLGRKFAARLRETRLIAQHHPASV